MRRDRWLILMVGLAWVLALLPPGASGEVPKSQRQSAAALNEANRLLRESHWDEAIEAYQAIEAASGPSALVQYNLAIAHYRRGEMERAAELFAAAAGAADLPLSAAAQFNLGNCRFAMAERDSQSSANRAAARDQLRHAIEAYRGALRGDPTLHDARANIELAVRKLADWQDPPTEPPSPESPPESPGDSREGEASERNDSSSQPNQPKSDQPDEPDQPAEKNDSKPSDSKSGADNSAAPQPDQEPANTTEPTEQPEQPEQSRSEQPSDRNADADVPKDRQAESGAAPTSPTDSSRGRTGDSLPDGELATEPQQDRPGDRQIGEGEKGMSPLEALKLLQSVRDRDMLRRIRRERIEMLRRVPVERDW